MSAITITVNQNKQSYDGPADKPLLWYLRDDLRLTGTKYGCGVAACGACTVLVDGKSARACSLQMGTLADKTITTIEGLEQAGKLHPVQEAWIAADVPQCGYCQAGQIMATIDLLKRKPQPSETDLAGITNLCRCGTHVRIKLAIADAANRIRLTGGKS
jgi:isoquinoline 1-oxidoreductase alpha subunit